jgi:hypothetical protein
MTNLPEYAIEFAYLTVNFLSQGRWGLRVLREGGRIVAAFKRGASPFSRAHNWCRLYEDKKNGILKSETRIKNIKLNFILHEIHASRKK